MISLVLPVNLYAIYQTCIHNILYNTTEQDILDTKLVT